MEKLNMILFTDGSCSFNPGPGGFAVVGLNDEAEVIYAYSKKATQTTNNRMELFAILHAMQRFGHSNTPLTLYSDSTYAVKTLNDWMFAWAAKGWKTARNATPENLDIVKEYYDLYQKGYRLNLVHVRGHNKIFGNELADKLATGKITPEEVLKKYGRKE